MNSNLPKILLFGLSADMPHKGHIEWIFFLKKTFKTHTIIVMPCSINTLGKKDKTGNLIYPSNGYIRWEMLYDYFQKHDQDIIVSQYEIAINIPSRTHTTIEYLQHTPISQIKSQRGYVLPIQYPNTTLNEVSIAIGTDIIPEFDKWHEWEKILKTAKIIIMNRAGFEHINIQKISNPKLKSAIICGINQGAIIEVSGPKIDISSRKLKTMLQENVNDGHLLEYIPKDILTFIKTHQNEFSNAYYQNPKARKIYELAMQAYKKAVCAFDLQRKTNFSAFITDFIKLGVIDKYQDEGYKLINGRLNIDLHKLDHAQFNKQIQSWMQQTHCEWYETRKPSGKIISPHEFNANFKLLGKYGPNLAVDLIIFIQDSEALKLVTITRNDDQKALAIPGGFYQGGLFTTAAHELLEECFSNRLFVENSLSSQLIDKIYKNNLNLLIQKITNILPDAYQDCLQSIKLPSTIISFIIKKASEHYKNQAQSTHLITKLKCDLYINLLPDAYQKLNDFIIKRGILSPEEPSLTDPRNTNLAWMTIRCFRFMITKSEWQNLLNECALDLSGGDDAASAAVINLSEFYENNARHFALHKYLVLREFAKLTEVGLSV